jgi:enoyl-CoA hydratase/carnithine racemase
MADEVIYEVRDGIALLTINRPEARNALNRAARDAFGAACDSFATDQQAKVLIITGAGEQAFCAGADLKEMADSQMRIPPKNLFVEFNRTLKTDKPIIAAVNGHAFAGGFRIAQMVDLVVSADHATYAITEPKVGRGAPWASPLAWLVGPRIALELLTTAQPLSAQRMYDLGFVNRMVPYGDLLQEADSMARAIADNAPLSVRAGKRMVYDSASLGWEEGLDHADALWEHVYLSDDGQEGPRAFREKRKPVWAGR